MRDLLLEGIVFFNDGRYFDAHEAWEDLWREADGPVRLFYQGLIQAAVGMHHLRRGNLNGACSQLGKSLDKLELYPGAFCGINNGRLVSEIRAVLDARSLREIKIERSGE